jgi:ribosomal protein S18 acetylase RimI-like enzyme
MHRQNDSHAVDRSLASAPLHVLDAPRPSDIGFLEERIDEHNMTVTGIRDARLLAIFVRDASDAIVAGVYGWTWGGCCEVQMLWVDDRYRGRGFGTRVMNAAEAEARLRGATQIVLSTHTFQAPAFYARLGFVEVGRVDGYPAGHAAIYLRKALVDDQDD